jgi:hypothetical protein
MRGRHLSIGSRITERGPALTNRFVPVGSGASASPSQQRVGAVPAFSLTTAPISSLLGARVTEATSIIADTHGMQALARVGMRMSTIGKHASGKHSSAHPRDRDHDGKLDHDPPGKKTGLLKGEKKRVGAAIEVDNTDARLAAMGMTPYAGAQPAASLIAGEWTPLVRADTGTWERVSPAEAQGLIGARRHQGHSHSAGSGHSLLIVKNRRAHAVHVMFTQLTGRSPMSYISGGTTEFNVGAGATTEGRALTPGEYSFTVRSQGKTILDGHRYTVVAGRKLVLRIRRGRTPRIVDATHKFMSLVRGDIATDAVPDTEVRSGLRFERYTPERAAQAVAAAPAETARVGWSVTALAGGARPISNAWTTQPIGAPAPTANASAAANVKPIHAYRLADLASSQHALVRMRAVPHTTVTAVSPEGERVLLGGEYALVKAGVHDLEVCRSGKPARLLPGAIVLHAGSEYLAQREGQYIAVRPEEEHAAARLAQYAPGLKPVANSVLIVDRATNKTVAAPIGSFLTVQSDDYTLRGADGSEYAIAPNRLNVWDAANRKSAVQAIFVHPADSTATVLVIGS